MPEMSSPAVVKSGFFPEPHLLAEQVAAFQVPESCTCPALSSRELSLALKPASHFQLGTAASIFGIVAFGMLSFVQSDSVRPVQSSRQNDSRPFGQTAWMQHDFLPSSASQAYEPLDSGNALLLHVVLRSKVHTGLQSAFAGGLLTSTASASGVPRSSTPPWPPGRRLTARPIPAPAPMSIRQRRKPRKASTPSVGSTYTDVRSSSVRSGAWKACISRWKSLSARRTEAGRLTLTISWMRSRKRLVCCVQLTPAEIWNQGMATRMRGMMSISARLYRSGPRSKARLRPSDTPAVLWLSQGGAMTFGSNGRGQSGGSCGVRREGIRSRTMAAPSGTDSLNPNGYLSIGTTLKTSSFLTSATFRLPPIGMPRGLFWFHSRKPSIWVVTSTVGARLRSWPKADTAKPPERSCSRFFSLRLCTV